VQREKFEALVAKALEQLPLEFQSKLENKITIFQKPIETRRHPDKQIETEIQKVVCHEIAHHFGSTEESLRRIESERLRKISRLR
jgi:predicted Zn-dependent protease with MMP-like domain